jgi:hypothetical protein
MTDNITALRPKAKDPTGAQRQARFRNKRKLVVTARRSASPAPIALPTPPPQAGRDIPPVTAPRDGNATIDVAAYTAAIGLASVAALFSVKGMVQLFLGTPVLIIAMASMMEASKLVTAGWRSLGAVE